VLGPSATIRNAVLDSNSPSAPYVVPADSFLVRAIEKAASDETGALDVFLNDPKSWAAPLMRPNISEPLLRDRRILEESRVRLIIPLATHDQVLGFLALGERLSEEPYSREDKRLLLTVAEQTAIALDYAHLIGQVAEQELLKRDIAIAKQVQAQLFPQSLPDMPSLECTAVCRPAREVGGDYYDLPEAVRVSAHGQLQALLARRSCAAIPGA
jgi:hypothetical protein